MGYEMRSSKDTEAMLRRQLLFYAQTQDQILEDAKNLAQEFYSFQKTFAHQIRRDDEKREWSDLSINVRKIRGYVIIHWRVRKWYKSSKDGKKSFNAEHIKKQRNSKNYKRSLAMYTSPLEFDTVMELEDKFIHLREMSIVVRDAHKQLMSTAKKLGLNLEEKTQAGEQETAYAIHDRIGNLLMLLRYRLWPRQSEADTQAGFVPLIDASAGVPREANAQAVQISLRKIDREHETLGDLLMGKSPAKGGHH